MEVRRRLGPRPHLTPSQDLGHLPPLVTGYASVQCAPARAAAARPSPRAIRSTPAKPAGPATAGVGGTLGDGGGAYALVDDDEMWQATMRGQLAAGLRMPSVGRHADQIWAGRYVRSVSRLR
jgi:hypothetical protein